MRRALLVFPLLLAACVATPVRVTGPHASALSPADVQQIKTLVDNRRDFGHPLGSIVAVSHDRAHVVTRRSDGERRWTGTSYYVVRRGERWVVADPDGFEAATERIITVH